MLVFSKKKFLIKYPDLCEYYETKDKWVNICDGKEVVDGYCELYAIDDDWCIEVPDVKMSIFQRLLNLFFSSKTSG